jgi:dipeptidase E
MRFLLTSSGISNTNIHDALVDLLGKPIVESSALVIPTAIYPFPGGAGMAAQLIRGVAKSPLCELGWRSLGVLELTALPSIGQDTYPMTISWPLRMATWTARRNCVQILLLPANGSAAY